MRTSLSDAGRQAIAKAIAKRKDSDEADELTSIESDVEEREARSLSAASGWKKRVEDAKFYRQRCRRNCTLKIKEK